MAVKIGNNDITLKLGSADVSAAYIGDTLVYSGGTPPTPTGVTCNDLVLPDGDYFTANTTDKSIQIPYGGVSSNDITVVECGYGYLEIDSIDSNYIYLDIVNSPKDGDYDCISIRINGDKCANIDVKFLDSGGNLQYIPQGTDMTQYYNRQITRFKIGDSSLPSGYQVVNIAFSTGGQGTIDAWGGVNLNFGGTRVASLPCDVSGFDEFNNWFVYDQNWSYSNNNPFTDLWIEFA